MSAEPQATRAAAAHPRLLYVVGRLDRAVRRELDGRLRGFGLTSPQYTALSVLSARTGLSNAQLARRSYVTPQSMSETILMLERRGLIRRAPDRLNKRILRTVLTTKGHEVLRSCDAAADEIETTMLRHLSEAERDRLSDELIGCVHNLGAGL